MTVASHVTFLTQHPVSFFLSSPSKKGGPFFLRARKVWFKVEQDGTHGVACHFDGTSRNMVCVLKSIQARIFVNIWCPDSFDVPGLLSFLSECGEDMSRVTITV